MNSILYFLILCNIVYYGLSLQIDLNPGDYKCVGQELDQEDVAMFLFGGSLPNDKKSSSSQKLFVTVTNPSDSEIIKERVLIGSRPKEFQRTISERGVYYICFDLPESGAKQPIRAFFHVDAKSRAVQAMEQAQKLGKSDLSALEIQLKSAEDLLGEISKEIDFSSRQEILLREANDAMTTRIHRFGYLSIGILAFSSLWQLIYLRRFFISKKLL